MQPERYSDPAKEEMKLMKSWLAFLPQIKQDIQSLLALPQNQKLPPGVHYHESVPFLELTKHRKIFSDLQESLSRLDKLPTIQEIFEEADRMRLSSIFREFQKVKLRTSLAILALRTNLELGLIDHGSYIIPDPARSDLGKFTVIHSWAVNVMPFSYAPARIVVTYEDFRYRVAFGICLSPESTSTFVVQITLSSDWRDPLEEPLRQLNLFQKERQLSMDGIEYELSCVSETSKSIIWFGNPFTSPLMEIEKAFFSIAEMVVREKGQDAEGNYLKEWRRYIER